MIPCIDPEFKGLIPPLLGDELDQLEQNIVSDGECRDAIILWEGVIIDGHNRFEICMKHGIEFKITEMEFSSRDEAKIWILENQLGRRNLTDAARIELALEKAELLRERARQNLTHGGRPRKDGAEKPLAKTSKLTDDPVNVRKAVADEAGVGERTLHRYMDVKQNGSPELVSRVKSGELKIGTAHQMLEKEIIKQLRRADKMYEYVSENLQSVLHDATEAESLEINSRLVNLAILLDSLLERTQNANNSKN